MAEYIDREAALAICEEEYREQLRMINYAGDSVAWNIGHAIKELPAADVVHVVRCKDCKFSFYWVKDLACGSENAMCDFVREDFYCEYGEKKEGEENG